MQWSSSFPSYLLSPPPLLSPLPILLLPPKFLPTYLLLLNPSPLHTLSPPFPTCISSPLISSSPTHLLPSYLLSSHSPPPHPLLYLRAKVAKVQYGGWYSEDVPDEKAHHGWCELAQGQGPYPCGCSQGVLCESWLSAAQPSHQDFLRGRGHVRWE